MSARRTRVVHGSGWWQKEITVNVGKKKRMAIAIFVDQRVNLLGVACDNESHCGCFPMGSSVLISA